MTLRSAAARVVRHWLAPPSPPASASVPAAGPSGLAIPAKVKLKKRKQVEEDDEFRDSRGTGPSAFLANLIWSVSVLR